MSNLKLIEMLCALVEDQAKIIRHLSMELSHERSLTEAEQIMIASTHQKYSDILGDEETPDDLPI